MRKLVYTAMGAAVLASASIANAAVTVTNSTNLSSPNPTSSIVTNDGITTINFGQNPVTSPTFNGSFTFTNTVAGLYSFVIGSSTIGLSFDTSMTSVSGGGQTWDFTALSPRQLSLDPIALAANTAYTVTFGGSSPAGGAVTGNVTISALAVPEAATWAMMLLGFGAMGLVIRRRRHPVLAQLA